MFVGSCPVSVVSSSRTIAQKKHFYIHNVSAANLLPSQFEQVLQDGRVPDGVWTELLGQRAPTVEVIERARMKGVGRGRVGEGTKTLKIV